MAGQPPLPYGIRPGQSASGGRPEEQVQQEGGSTAADVLLQVQAVIRDLAKGRPRRGNVAATAAPEGSGGVGASMAAAMGAALVEDSFDLKRRELEALHFELQSKVGELQSSVADSSLPPGMPPAGGRSKGLANSTGGRAAAITDVEERIRRKLTELTQLTDSIRGPPSAPLLDPIDGSGGRKRGAADAGQGAAIADRCAAAAQHDKAALSTQLPDSDVLGVLSACKRRNALAQGSGSKPAGAGR